MAKKANTLIADAITRHQVYLERIAGQIRNMANAELERTVKDLSALLKNKSFMPIDKKVLSSAFARDMDRLTRKIERIRKPGYIAAEKAMSAEFEKLVNNEIAFINSSINQGIGFDAGLKIPPPTTIDNILALGNYNGLTIQQWYTGWEDGDIRRITATVRNGLAQGQTLDQISNAVVGRNGAINATRQQTQTMARTLTNGITNSARSQFYEQNSDVISQYLYSAVLDGRTSLICAGLSGETYKKLEDAPQPPLHPNCRSAIVPVVDGFGIVGNRPSVGGTNFNTAAREDYISNQLAKGATKTEARAKWSGLSNSYKNTLRNKQIDKWDKSVIGSAPAGQSYNDWLKSQPKSFQDDVLGKTRADAWRAGGKDSDGNPVTMSAFVDQNTNKLYTIEQLRRIEPKLIDDDRK